MIVSYDNYCSGEEQRGVGYFSSVAASVFEDSRLDERELPRDRDTSGPRVRDTALGSNV